MANEAILSLGTELVLETAAGSAALANGDYEECTDDTRTSTDNAGYPLGIFEFDTANTASPFTATPTAGAALHLYEQKINSNTADAPDVSATNEHDYMWTFSIEAANSVMQSFVTPPLPINRSGGKYWLRWVDGGAGTAGMDLAWELRLTPVTYGT